MDDGSVFSGQDGGQPFPQPVGVEQVPNAQAPAGRARYLLAIPSGFGEVSASGKSAEAELVRAARDRGMRVVGPNCMGMVNAAAGINASLAPQLPPGGPGLSCLTQSGGFAIAVTMYALDHQMAVAKLCDLGNTSDVQLTEVLRHFRDDPQTRVVGLFLESAREPEALCGEIAELARAKPVVITALGRSEAGARASLAHLGLTPDLDQASREKIAASAIWADTGSELLNAAKARLWQPEAGGRRAAVVTGTGGIGAELADLCVDLGLLVPALSDRLQAALGAHLPAYACLGNPIDATPVWWDYPAIYPAVIDLLAKSDEVDLIVASITDVATTVDALARNLAELRPAKPLVVFWGARDEALDNMRVLEAGRVPCYRSTWETARGAAALAGRPMQAD